MKTIKLILFHLMLLLSFRTNAQTGIKSLKVGDTIPALILKNLIGRDKPVNLSSLHQQDLLIINFWATWCPPCVKELSKLDSLVSINHGKLAALSVAYESRAKVTDLLKYRPDIKTSDLNMLTDDKVLIQYFKHHVLPHNIWVGKDGVIKYITGGDEINQKNIDAFYNNAKMVEHEKRDIMNFDAYKPFHLSDSVYNYRSIQTSFIDGITGGITTAGVWHHPTEKWLTRVFSHDESIEQLLWSAIDRNSSYQNLFGVMKILTKDSLRFYWPEQCPQTFARSKYKTREDWKPANLYCYELTLPYAEKDTVFFGYMLNDLERMFHIAVMVEKEKIPVCILSLEAGRSFPVPENDSTYINVNHDHLVAHNVSLKYLCEYLNKLVVPNLNAKPLDPPYLDETGINSRIDLNIIFDNKVNTYAEMQEYITKKYGIHFKVEERMYPVTIVKDLAP